MKKKFRILSISLTILVSACNKDLNQIPISQGTTVTFYKSPSDFIQGTNAIYNDLRGYPDRLLNLSEIRSDNIYGVSSQGVRDWDPINSFQKAITGNTYVEEAWNTDFNGIFRANTVIDQLDQNGSYVNSPSLALRLMAEARFLRAFYYFDLIRYFGKLPIIQHPLLVSQATSIPRSPVGEVYKLIISDLQFAILNLPPFYYVKSTTTPVTNTSNDVGRATKYAAEATLALVYMTRSGPTYGVEGPGLASNEWSLAIPLLNDVIASGQFALNTTSYANVFSYANQSPQPSGNTEAVFDVMYISGQNPVLGATYPWALTPAQYMSSPLVKDTKSNGSLEIIPVSNDLLNSYSVAPVDKRKANTIYTAGYVGSLGPEARPFFMKYLDVTKIPAASRFDWGINFIAIRYTDVLLLKAECVLNGAPGSQATDVDAVVNQVRARAGLAAISGVTLAQLFDERRREFADEGSRWFDLQRSGTLVTTMNTWINKEDYLHQMNQVIPGYIVYPVPQSQLDAVPGLYTQNTGY